MITRCTQDIAGIDSQLTFRLQALVSLLLGMVVKLCGPLFFTPVFLLPGILIGVVGAYLANIYLKAQMSVKREQRHVRHFCAMYHMLIVPTVTLVRPFWLT